MKKLLLILLCLPMLFTTCKKEEEESNNNNSSLTIHQTIWEVTSFEETNGNNPTTTINIPCGDQVWDTGLTSVRWTFIEDSNTLIVKIIDGYGDVDYDTLSYSYFPQNNVITVQILTNTNWSENMINEDLDVNLISHTSNSLVVEQDGLISTSSNNWKFRTYLTKVN